jgi:hypothetical protein
MPHIPAAFTTISQSMSPRVVCTVVTRRPSTVMRSTRVCSTMRAPRWRAPLAMAMVTLAGSM